MATFAYSGRTRAGETVSGEREAESMEAVVSALRREQVLVTKVNPVKEQQAAKAPKAGKTPKVKSVSAKNLAVFTRQFSVMIDAGLPLVQCLDILGNQEEHKYFSQVILQILVMDLVFSIDSIITAIGMVREIWVMYVAVVVSVGVMLFAAEPISNFVNKHPAFKMLALCFLLIIGFALITEGMGLEIPKGYIYFSMAFAFLVDLLQMRMNKKRSRPVNTREHYRDDEGKLPKDIL
jgi:hypothetical protein